MIGPEIPPHLLQNNTLDNDPKSSICPKTLEYPTKRFEEFSEAGSQIPAALPMQDKQEQNDEAGDDFGPVLPPDMLLQRSNSSVLKPGFPYVPPQASSSAHASGASGLPHPIGQYEDSDDGSDDFGPKPLLLDIPPMHEKDAVAEFMEKEERRRQNEEKAKEPKALKREEWMLVPPSASDLFRNIDTTKLKARQFARTSGSVNKGNNSLWTETPVERQQRIADEVAGKKRRAIDVANEEALGVGSSNGKRSKREAESIKKGVDEYTRKMRGPSLVEQHSMQKKSEGEDDAPKAIWDHSRDMAIGGRLMDNNKRNQMIHEAKGLGDRFGKGGSFL